jgi:hypothetical protein
MTMSPAKTGHSGYHADCCGVHLNDAEANAFAGMTHFSLSATVIMLPFLGL